MFVCYGCNHAVVCLPVTVCYILIVVYCLEAAVATVHGFDIYLLISMYLYCIWNCLLMEWLGNVLSEMSLEI